MDWTDLPYTECLRGGESEMLQFALDRVRRQFAWKTGGLDAEQLRRQHRPSTMTLAGLIKHDLRRRRLHLSGRGPAVLGPPWDARSWSENDQWGWESAVTDDPGELYAAWYAAAERSRTTWAKLSDHNGLDVIVEDSDPEWSKKRRRILIDLLEEYLKHTGHADLLREAVDGVRGNDPD